jgi:pyruvate dehydrogenase E1 component alpha subunit
MSSQWESFDAEPLTVIDKDGRLVGELPKPAKDVDFVLNLYRAMVLARTFDTRAVALQRTGRLGTYASCLGQEAIGTGIAFAMSDQDVLLPSFSEHAAHLIRGVTPTELLGSHFSHAAGVALAKAQLKEAGAAVAIGGDGATSKGDFYEAINVIGVWQLPAIFVINNNQWAISVPTPAQTASETLAQKAIAAGIPGVRVDGNDVLAVFAATSAALDRVQSGDGPTLIECLSYRLSDHTTADDAGRYRDEEEVSRHWPDEPVRRLRQHLVDNHGWTKEDEETLIRTCAEEIESAAEAYLNISADSPSAMFNHLYETLPENVEQMDAEAKNG